ncbi:MAG: hypothetical protein ACH350_02255 [Parachlamydiaceae bacterium]
MRSQALDLEMIMVNMLMSIITVMIIVSRNARRQINLLETAIAYTATISHAITTKQNVIMSQRQRIKSVVVMFLSTMKNNVAGMFHKLTVNNAAVMYRKLIILARLNIAPNILAKNVVVINQLTTISTIVSRNVNHNASLSVSHVTMVIKESPTIL